MTGVGARPPATAEAAPDVERAPSPDEARAAANAAMERYAAGDDEAFGALYDALAPRLYQFLLRQSRDQARAEDLVQQTMLQMHVARGRFIPGSEVFPWAFAIGRRLLIDGVRRRKNEVPFDAEPINTAPPTDERLHSLRLADALERELLRLPEAHRVAFELIKREGLSMREAAQVLGTTVVAVKLRAHRAYVALRAALGEVVE
jgi:RNA polymerase sigma-70 factor (ECF subfamily)